MTRLFSSQNISPYIENARYMVFHLQGLRVTRSCRNWQTCRQDFLKKENWDRKTLAWLQRLKSPQTIIHESSLSCDIDIWRDKQNHATVIHFSTWLMMGESECQEPRLCLALLFESQTQWSIQWSVFQQRNQWQMQNHSFNSSEAEFCPAIISKVDTKQIQKATSQVSNKRINNCISMVYDNIC